MPIALTTFETNSWHGFNFLLLFIPTGQYPQVLSGGSAQNSQGGPALLDGPRDCSADEGQVSRCRTTTLRLLSECECLPECCNSGQATF
jgi:hypothetical protein